MVPPVQPVADYLNESAHHFATQIREEREQAPVATSTFDLEALLAVCLACGVDPNLWEAWPNAIGCIIMVCVIVFLATGGCCTAPLHTLLTDCLGCIESDLWEAVTKLTHSSNEKLVRRQSESYLHETKVRIT